ncbi:hypothetical protein CoNPh10_CDS0014 [Staphylococcus phage S-CoN_Ph10]|uniref:Uncharacterized protein n=2 Tax=Sextaecvirus TaxID=1922243 RepID=A0A060AKP0_9CAUD|nr:hypothetical protein PHAGE6E_121 [Staphylococcus phage 6ec]WNM51410.1 hypothetical protein CoNPh1_CDS0011 [Staphylococcus phage S-CoN_Ph1]WNM51702.1 hypothetical protein CoNPh2_CDS0148 [Staphylococcus phage S-CoN_Ph2]WNM51863.1 hypothetical protein CoNPh3_CDS0149 [Staphylococcus phage S-CoN_Ph3]WNM51888.1 hypothetical protein CoNPh4_CDS0012 [Staphylococcus phage S-CoN_Ph4]WNM52071.1 hypothetical protein CoNPh5_CDS0025 [Staphylococcus phage S-CoN_Ph5]WNM52362.1 hypothetical protein CoNPh6_C
MSRKELISEILNEQVKVMEILQKYDSTINVNNYQEKTTQELLDSMTDEDKFLIEEASDHSKKLMDSYKEELNNDKN